MSLRIFISYKRDVKPDEDLAGDLAQALEDDHEVFLDRESIRPGQRWARRLEEGLAVADFFLTLVSAHSVASDMVVEEIARAYERERDCGRPVILWVRVAFDGKLPMPLSAYLKPIQAMTPWKEPSDTPRLVEEVRAAMAGDWPVGGATEGKASVAPAAPAQQAAAGPIFIQPNLTAKNLYQAQTMVIAPAPPDDDDGDGDDDGESGG